MRATWMGLLCLAGSLAGCAESGTDDPSQDLISRTIVVLHGAAPADVRQVTVTRAQSDAERRARLHLPNPAGPLNEATTTQDTNCAPSSMWIFSQSSCSGSYEICFSGQGEAVLGDYIQHLNYYPTPPTTWQNHMSCFADGTEDGYFTSGGEFPTCTQSFIGGHEQNTTITCAWNQYYGVVFTD